MPQSAAEPLISFSSASPRAVRWSRRKRRSRPGRRPQVSLRPPDPKRPLPSRRIAGAASTGAGAADEGGDLRDPRDREDDAGRGAVRALAGPRGGRRAVHLLEEEGHEFGFPPTLEDYRALAARSVRSLTSPPLLPGVVFDRTPVDYLAYMAATGADPSAQASAAALRPAFASLDLLVITLITPENRAGSAARGDGRASPGDE